MRPMEIEYTMTPDDLKAFLREHKLSNHGFADLIKVSGPAVDHWLSGRRNIPATTVKLINFFKAYPSFMTLFKEV